MSEPPRAPERLHVALGRAVGGALFFSLPVLMTAEVWQLGVTMSRGRLAALVLAFAPLLVVLDRYSGFERTSRWLDDVVDAAAAVAVGFATSAVVLPTLGVIGPGQALDEVLGKLALHAIPASFGAVLARSQFGQSGEGAEHQVGYAGELLFMLAGAVYFSFSIAPSDEIPWIAAQMSPWGALGLWGASVLCMHAFVYAVDFRGSEAGDPGATFLGLFVRYTVVGYAISLGASALFLGAFGRFDGAGTAWMLREVVVLAFPASLGAAAARLIL